MESAIGCAEPVLRERFGELLDPRWLALRLIEGDRALAAEAGKFLGADLLSDPEISAAVERGRMRLAEDDITLDILRDRH